MPGGADEPTSELEILKRKLAEYKALPDDLTIRLMWIDANPPPKTPFRCQITSKIYRHLQLDWHEVEQELKAGRNPLKELRGLCPAAREPEEPEEEEEG